MNDIKEIEYDISPKMENYLLGMEYVEQLFIIYQNKLNINKIIIYDTKRIY